MLSYAQAEDSEFTALRPLETGLPNTVYASENPDYPTIIIDDRPGVNFYPSSGSKALRIGERTGDPTIDQWISDNLSVLRAYCAGEIDTYEFNRNMRPLGRRLDEMPNYDRGRYNVPLAFFIRPEGSGAEHAARVKVNANYNLNFDPQNNFSIGFFPTTGVMRGHNVGQAKQSDVNGMIAWLEAHRQTFIDYNLGATTTQQFETYLMAHPYS